MRHACRFVDWEAEVSGEDSGDEEEEDEEDEGGGFIDDEPEYDDCKKIKIKSSEKICDPDELANTPKSSQEEMPVVVKPAVPVKTTDMADQPVRKPQKRGMKRASEMNPIPRYVTPRVESPKKDHRSWEFMMVPK